MPSSSQGEASESNNAFSSWSEILDQLLLGRHLSSNQAQGAMREILDGNATQAQIAAFMISLRASGESVDELTGLTRAMLDAAAPVDTSSVDASKLLDTCGTGGDRSGTINVSTMAALIAAAGGAMVAKHGNRASSSQTGSADVLEALGVTIDLGAKDVMNCIRETGFGFFLAPRYHPGFKFVGPVRKELGVRTAFNFLGPLINPARVQRQVIGVSDPAVAPLMMGVLKANGTKRAMVLFGHDGLDELTTTTTSTIYELKGGAVREYEIDPEVLGLSLSDPAALKGGAPAENAARVRSILEGEKHPQQDIVALNAAAAFVVSDLVNTMADGVELAKSLLNDGAGVHVLDQLVRVSSP